MKSQSEKAAIASVFTYIQFALAIVSGIVLFPLVIQAVGARDYGLWLATGEAISFVLLGDLGVFAVLPWLVAARIGAEDFDSLRQHLSNAIAIGCAIGSALLVCCIVALLLNPVQIGISIITWDVVFYPTVFLLIINAIGYPFRAFNAVLAGAQDVIFSGLLSVFQSVLLVALTALMLTLGGGILGLAVALGLPPFVISLAAFLRVISKHSYALQGMNRPDFAGCLFLFREGSGAWLGGLGVRMMAASNGLILTGLGRPEWATVYASTLKMSQILAPLCSTLPDGGLVGVSHVHASGDQARTRRSVVCLVLLYAVMPSFAGVGLSVANPAFVSWWIGPSFYAGHYVNFLTTFSLVTAGLAGGLVKLVAVVGWRQTVGWWTLLAGCVYALLGFILARWRGQPGLAEATVVVWLGLTLPVGLHLVSRVYQIGISDFAAVGGGRWLLVTLVMTVVASFLGVELVHSPLWAFLASLACVGVYGLLIRQTLSLAPWPAKVRYWLCRFRLITI